MARTVRDSCGFGRELLRNRKEDRRAESNSSGGAGLRGQSDCGCDSLSPRGAQRWFALGLSLGHRTQARLARARRDRMKPALDWQRIGDELSAQGCASTGPLLTPQQCESLATAYADDALFRSRVVMARHGYGRGEYRYFSYPLPQILAETREAFYT